VVDGFLRMSSLAPSIVITALLVSVAEETNLVLPVILTTLGEHAKELASGFIFILTKREYLILIILIRNQSLPVVIIRITFKHLVMKRLDSIHVIGDDSFANHSLRVDISCRLRRVDETII
jgi:hypothetical protein